MVLLELGGPIMCSNTSVNKDLHNVDNLSKMKFSNALPRLCLLLEELDYDIHIRVSRELCALIRRRLAFQLGGQLCPGNDLGARESVGVCLEKLCKICRCRKLFWGTVMAASHPLGGPNGKQDVSNSPIQIPELRPKFPVRPIEAAKEWVIVPPPDAVVDQSLKGTGDVNKVGSHIFWCVSRLPQPA